MKERKLISNLRKRHEVAPSCPCGKSNKDGKFTPYEDDPTEGYCHSCGKSFFNKSGSNKSEWNTWENLGRPVFQPKPISYMEQSEFKRSLNAPNDKNTLVQYFIDKLGLESTKKLIDRYHIGTGDNKYNVVFWYVDKNQKVRSGKIMQYENGHRKGYINWTHSKKEDFNFKRCLFGEHLMNESNDVAIVESEKTAIICAHFMPEYTWMAVGGTAITEANLKALYGKNVYLFPDNGKYYEWQNVEYNDLLIIVSDMLEKDNVKPGSDLADLLLDYDKTIIS